MPNEDTSPVEPLAGDTVNTSAHAATTSTEPLAGDGKEAISLEEARKIRSESANLRKRLKAFEDAEEATRTAQLSEMEKSADRANKAEAKIQQYQKQLVTAQVKMAAQAKGIIDPDIAALAIQHDLELDSDGMPTNLDKALDTLVKNKPYLLAAKAEAPATQQAQPTPQVPTPQIPAMNPGRSSITSPNSATLPAGKAMKLTDIPWSR
jgi:hypothetical protein